MELTVFSLIFLVIRLIHFKLFILLEKNYWFPYVRFTMEAEMYTF